MEHILREVLIKIKYKPVKHSIFRIQDNESSMCGFYITFIEYMLAITSFLGGTLFIRMTTKTMATKDINCRRCKSGI